MICLCSQFRCFFSPNLVLEHGRVIPGLLGFEFLLWLHFDDGTGLLQTGVQVFVQHDVLLGVVVLAEWAQSSPYSIEIAVAFTEH